MNDFANLKNSYEDLPSLFYTKVRLSPVSNPKLILLNRQLAEKLGLSIKLLESKEGVQVLSGNTFAKGEYALSQAYAGHQFGHFTMLGDGRALMLGERVTPSGYIYDLQLKGSGKTPYSRGGDGRGTLSSMLREYIISEAMHGLGVPTSRSLAVVGTGELVHREKVFPGAILTRVAASHIRVGTFQYAASKGSKEDLKKLADYSILRHYKDCTQGDDRYLCFYRKVVASQARLIAKWQSKGFIHGVMNTDNMTISGETIDYGPCAFMDEYKKNTVFSSIDIYGRYSYGNQAKIGAWNLARLGEALLPLFHENKEKSIELGEEALGTYYMIYNRSWLNEMVGKIGFDKGKDEYREIITSLLSIMEKEKLDFTNTFLGLMEEYMINQGLCEKSFHVFKDDSAIQSWKKTWEDMLKKSGKTPAEIIEIMKSVNHRFIPRNHLVEQALDDYENNGDNRGFENLLGKVTEPYRHDEKSITEDLKYQNPGPKRSKPYKTYCGT